MKQFTLLIALMAGIVMLSPPAAAKDRYHGGSIDARQHGYEHGYRDGFHQGSEDRSRNSGYNYKSHDYEEGDRGYEKYMGEKDDYKKGYREAYQFGYDDGYKGRPGRFADVYGPFERRVPNDTTDDIYANRRFGAADVAFDIGYRDGLDDGINDLRSNRSFRPEDHDGYRDSDHGYRSSYGDKDSYRRRYKQGYLQGYQDGYGRR